MHIDIQIYAKNLPENMIGNPSIANIIYRITNHVLQVTTSSTSGALGKQNFYDEADNATLLATVYISKEKTE